MLPSQQHLQTHMSDLKMTRSRHQREERAGLHESSLFAHGFFHPVVPWGHQASCLNVFVQTIDDVIIWFLSCFPDRMQTPGGEELALSFLLLFCVQTLPDPDHGLSQCVLSNPKSCLSAILPKGSSQEGLVIWLILVIGFTFLETSE